MSGRINLDNISDDFKSYLQGLGLTEEQVNEAISLFVGDKELLETNDKSSIVNAINENKTSILENTDLANQAIQKANEAFQSGVNIKNNMVQAINSKITVPDINTDNTWDDIVSSVKNIKEAQGTAVATDVLSGKTFTNSTGNLVTGTMVNRGGATTVTPTTSNQTKAAGYYSGDITIKGDSNLVASNIISGKSIFGVAGNATPIPSLNVNANWSSYIDLGSYTKEYTTSSNNLLTLNNTAINGLHITAIGTPEPQYLFLSYSSGSAAIITRLHFTDTGETVDIYKGGNSWSSGTSIIGSGIYVFQIGQYIIWSYSSRYGTHANYATGQYNYMHIAKLNNVKSKLGRSSVKLYTSKGNGTVLRTSNTSNNLAYRYLTM